MGMRSRTAPATAPVPAAKSSPPESSAVSPPTTSATPTDTVQNTLSRATVTFSEPVDLGSFTPAEVTLTGPNGVIPVNQPTLISGSTYSISFPGQTTEGSYTLTISPGVTD